VSEKIWGLAQYVRPGRTAAETGFLTGGVVHASADFGATPVLDLLGDWERFEPALRRVDPSRGEVVEGARLIAPITYPRKLLCAGANYYGHAAEMGSAPPEPGTMPFFFLKPPTTTIVGDGATVTYPAGADDPRLDWEAELAVVVSRTARDVTAGQARDYIAGYSVANDLSARGPFARPDAEPFAYDWMLQKAQDGFCPFGPAIVPAWLVADPQDLPITLTVNGVTKQDSATSDMVIGVLDLVSSASRILTLEPGDVILTGTPGGVGLPRKDFLYPGDLVAASIGGIGVLTSHIGSPR
jgi:2-keto-4-pentenoate hydratase/2-oxohepta-3-ene-1,7-dioic acid hydratase in catechol pathway